MNTKLVQAVFAVAIALTVPALADDPVKAGGSQALHQSMMSGMEKMHDMKMSGDNRLLLTVLPLAGTDAFDPARSSLLSRTS